jgi:hypothetical protein
MGEKQPGLRKGTEMLGTSQLCKRASAMACDEPTQSKSKGTCRTCSFTSGGETIPKFIRNR